MLTRCLTLMATFCSRRSKSTGVHVTSTLVSKSEFLSLVFQPFPVTCALPRNRFCRGEAAYKERNVSVVRPTQAVGRTDTANGAVPPLTALPVGRPRTPGEP